MSYKSNNFLLFILFPMLIAVIQSKKQLWLGSFNSCNSYSVRQLFPKVEFVNMLNKPLTKNKDNNIIWQYCTNIKYKASPDPKKARSSTLQFKSKYFFYIYLAQHSQCSGCSSPSSSLVRSGPTMVANWWSIALWKSGGNTSGSNLTYSCVHFNFFCSIWFYMLILPILFKECFICLIF